MRKNIIYVLVFIIFLTFLLGFKYFFYYDKVFYYSGENKITLYVSDNFYKIRKGLSIFKKIKNNEGMIFIFPKEGIYGFWMKNMNFNIDLIWIDKNYKIIGFIKNFKKESYPKIYYPNGNIKYVIELKEGLINKLKINTGDKIIVQSK